MQVEKFDDLSLYQFASEVMQIGNRAVKKAQEENKKLGLPNVFTKNGKIYYELPNGEITAQSPLPD
jgi:hypothetical protein